MRRWGYRYVVTPTLENVDSLALGGETGTLQDEMTGTVAQGNCRGKRNFPVVHDVHHPCLP